MINKIAGIMHSALLDLFLMQPDVLETTNQTTMTEWNLAHHYACGLSKYLFWYDHDNDVVKRNYDSKRPDTIFHKRRTNENNFLVVEMKKSIAINSADIQKIKEDWFSYPLSYRFGACVSIDSASIYKIEVFENDTDTEILATNESRRMFEYRKPAAEKGIRDRFREIMTQRNRLELRDIDAIFDGYRI
jgi:hypothetical protein